MARFRVLHGRHVEGGKTYTRGQIVDSKSDLDKMNSPGAKKFERLDGPRAVPVAPEGEPAGEEDELEGMTVEELRAYAAEEEIDLGGATRKADIISAIREHEAEG